MTSVWWWGTCHPALRYRGLHAACYAWLHRMDQALTDNTSSIADRHMRTEMRVSRASEATTDGLPRYLQSYGVRHRRTAIKLKERHLGQAT